MADIDLPCKWFCFGAEIQEWLDQTRVGLDDGQDDDAECDDGEQNVLC